MEGDVAMNEYSKKEALEEIKEVASFFPDIETLVVDNTGVVQGAVFHHIKIAERFSGQFLKTDWDDAVHS